MTDISTFQAATLAIAAVGAVLGIINTWRAVNQNRVKLKVLPAHAIPLGGAPRNIRFCVEVTNLSQFAVTIEDAGVLFHGTKDRGSIINPLLPDRGPWPRRLEPHSSVTVYSELPESNGGHKIKCAFARTQCGYIKTGTSPALRRIAGGKR
ncbi:MAG: hypothetical protein ABIQ36_03085 [Rhodanobacter sp.]